jgi:4-aminobutyrate aminotransferase-like enzyme
LQKKYDCIGDIRGTGLYWSIEFVKDQKTKEPDAALTLAAVNALREAHIFVSTFGLYENCMKLRPLLIMEPQHVDQFADSLDCVLERLTV